MTHDFLSDHFEEHPVPPGPRGQTTVRVVQGFSYICSIEGGEFRVYEADDCPACNASGRIDPHAVLGGELIETAGVCPVCHGDQVVRGPLCSTEEVIEVFGPAIAHRMMKEGVFDEHE